MTTLTGGYISALTPDNVTGESGELGHYEAAPPIVEVVQRRSLRMM
jgi:hypothetical protein